ncbi:MAG: hypothetical protein ACJ0BK_06595 [Coraliomargaritaceae bacterium]
MFRISPRPCFGMRRVILRFFGATVGSEVNIYSSALIYYPWNLKIGDHSSIGEWALIYNLGQVTIGERTTILQRAHLYAGKHDYKYPAMRLVKQPIEICTVAEALWYQAPVTITTDCLLEELETGSCGWWVETTQGAIQCPLREVLRVGPNQIRDIGLRGRELISEIYQWGGIANRAAEFYDWVVNCERQPNFLL